jgi:hypothetical protein
MAPSPLLQVWLSLQIPLYFIAVAFVSMKLFDFWLFSVSPLHQSAFVETSSPRFFLARSIGNALPPRHDPEQTFTNLNFTLFYEEEFPDLEKYWILNRIIDPTLLSRLIHLLDQYGQNYTIIPFYLEEYALQRFRFDYDQPALDIVHTYEYHTLKNDPKCPTLDLHHDDLSQVFRKGRRVQEDRCWNLFPRRQEWIDEAIQTDKNLYVTNQNVARNTMIQLGIERGATWILPWDGNCFLTPAGFHKLASSLETTTAKYAYTPMARALNNPIVLDPHYSPVTTEEPQVILHHSAQARFQPHLRYGRRNKVELLQRLKIPGPWFRKWSSYLKWELEKFKLLEPVPDLHVPAVSAGWVTRLYSGRSKLEISFQARGNSRTRSMTQLLQKLDDQVVRQVNGYAPEKLLYYSSNNFTNDSQALREMADQCMAMIANKIASVEYLQGNATLLALAYHVTGHKKYGQAASHRIAERLKVSDTARVLTNRNLVYFLDAIRMTRVFMTKSQRRNVKTWCRETLNWLFSSEQGKRAYTSSGSIGVWFDVQAMALAAYSNDTARMMFVLDRSVSRLTRVSESGQWFWDRLRIDCEEEQVLYLQGWNVLARMGKTLGRNLWSEYHQGFLNMSALCRASLFSIPYLQQRRPCGPKVEAARWWPLLATVYQECPQLAEQVSLSVANWIEPLPEEDMPFAYNPGTGIALFWQLGR